MPRVTVFSQAEQRLAAEAVIMKTASPEQIAGEMGIATRTLRGWVMRYKEAMASGEDVVEEARDAAARERAAKVAAIVEKNLGLLDMAIDRAREMVPVADNLGQVAKVIEVAWLRHMDMTVGRPGVKEVHNDNRSVSLNVTERMLEALRERPLADIMALAAPGPAAGIEPPVVEEE